MTKLLEVKVLPNRQLTNVLVSAAQGCLKTVLGDNYDENLAQAVTSGITHAFNNVILYGSSAREYDVTLRMSYEDDKLTVELLDTGLPGSFEDTDETKAIQSAGIDYEYINMLRDGRCQKMTFSLPVSVPELVPEDTDDVTPIEGAQITIRETNEDDFEEIARAFYRDMGYTYVYDVYDPEFMKKYIAKDGVHALSAVTENGVFAGFHCLKCWDDIPGIYEGGMAVTNPKVRKCGAFSKLMESNNTYFDDVIASGIQISCATCNHEITQKTRLKYGFTPCGFSFHILPADAYRSSFQEVICRASAALSCHVLDRRAKTVYVPEEVTHVLDVIYAGEKLERTYVTEDLEPEYEACEHQDSIGPDKISACSSMAKVGKDYKEMLTEYVRNCKRYSKEAAQVYFPIDHPGSKAFYEECKKLGFFFGGVIPGTGYGDLMLMNHTMNTLINYEALHTTGPFTEMLAMIKAFDPN